MPRLRMAPTLARPMSSSHHDAVFKAVLGKPEHARGALRSVVPAVVAEALDWPTLARSPGSFVDPVLRQRHTDLLFSVAWRGGGEALVYLLFEHQSTPDRLMAYRLLRYLVRIWEHWCTEHPGKEVLPVIVPVVLYHGSRRWSAALSFDALLEVPDGVRPAIEPYLVRFAYLMDDLSEVPDDRLRARAAMTALAKLVEVCFKHARTRADLVELLGEWADTMREVVGAADGLEALALVMRYILLVNDHVEPEALQALLERAVGPEAKDTIMTAGERLIQQGVQQGERKLLLRLLRKRFGDAMDADTERRLAAASPEQLETWAERMLSAATLTELLAD